MRAREKILVCHCTELHGVPVSQALQTIPPQTELNKKKLGDKNMKYGTTSGRRKKQYFDIAAGKIRQQKHLTQKYNIMNYKVKMRREQFLHSFTQHNWGTNEVIEKCKANHRKPS